METVYLVKTPTMSNWATKVFRTEKSASKYAKEVVKSLKLEHYTNGQKCFEPIHETKNIFRELDIDGKFIRCFAIVVQRVRIED